MNGFLNHAIIRHRNVVRISIFWVSQLVLLVSNGCEYCRLEMAGVCVCVLVMIEHSGSVSSVVSIMV